MIDVMTFCIIHKISTAQKYWFFSNAENVFPTGMFSFFTTLILTFSSQFLKHVISIRSAKTAQIAIVFTHAAWSSPKPMSCCRRSSPSSPCSCWLIMPPWSKSGTWISPGTSPKALPWRNCG